MRRDTTSVPALRGLIPEQAPTRLLNSFIALIKENHRHPLDAVVLLV
ncbi:hypothetical protein LTSERUB_6463 [Salmonella enterica subsp. enterica serovar Rubislaw str. A4-653]|uniref:Uncharacterized protein n=1 Tax=Salmonella enterica subsp. enterica serovar Rubislaw str. A4-653 TaxID=913081 RepID=G5QT79_SALRU|nr:hypothetical protein LTSERUB_6463 [Salmonella enterica subsp. enterica serovar Rubislaw str. A4-653]